MYIYMCIYNLFIIICLLQTFCVEIIALGTDIFQHITEVL